MKSEKYPQSYSSLQGAIRHENKSARHAIDDASFPRHPTHSLSTGPAHPHCGAATVQKTALTWPTHGHISIESTQGHTSIQRPGKRAEIRPNPRASDDEFMCGHALWLRR